MRLFYGVMLLAFFTSGCVTVETRKNVEQVTAVALPDPFVKVVIGMTHEEVTALLNDKVILGYEVDPLTETVRPIEVSRLYASEVFSAGNSSIRWTSISRMTHLMERLMLRLIFFR